MRVERIIGRYMEEEIALDITVDDIPDDRHEHDSKRHFAFALQQEGEDERTLEIMELKNEEEYPVRRILRHSAV